MSTYNELDPTTGDISTNSFEENPNVKGIFSIPIYCKMMDENMQDINYDSLKIKLKNDISPEKKQ